MREYLPDVGFSGFGVTAAWVLKDLWDREQGSPRDNTNLLRSDFAGVKSRRAERQKGAVISSAQADAILSVVATIIKPDAGEETHHHAIALASVAFLMPCAHKEVLINELLQLPGRWASKQPLLKSLVVAGEMISADHVIAGINELLERAKTEHWLLDQNSWQLDSWLVLLPFSDRPKALLDVINSLEPRLREPGRLHSVLSALGDAPSAEAEEILAELAQRDAKFLADYAWLDALHNRETLAVGRILFKLVCNGAFAVNGRHDARALSNKLAAGIRSYPQLRKEVYEQYPAISNESDKEIVARAIAESADAEGIMLLVRGYGAQRRNFQQTILYEALRNALTGQRPSAHFRGAKEMFGIPGPELRKMLFALTAEGDDLSDLAIDCLNAIADIREHYGGDETEPRHPDITIRRPWPIIRDWRKAPA